MPQMLTYIVGATYYDGGYDNIRRLREGAQLGLRAEPDNPHDPNAVAVLSRPKGKKIGHIPRQEAPAVAKILKMGLPCKIVCRKDGTTSVEITWETNHAG